MFRRRLPMRTLCTTRGYLLSFALALDISTHQAIFLGVAFGELGKLFLASALVFKDYAFLESHVGWLWLGCCFCGWLKLCLLL